MQLEDAEKRRNKTKQFTCVKDYRCKRVTERNERRTQVISLSALSVSPLAELIDCESCVAFVLFLFCILFFPSIIKIAICALFLNVLRNCLIFFIFFALWFSRFVICQLRFVVAVNHKKSKTKKVRKKRSVSIPFKL